MLLDDTVLLSTTRNIMNRKLMLLKQYCNTYDMGIKLTKTKIFVMIVVDNMRVEWCDRYVYLGSPFTANVCVFSCKGTCRKKNNSC